MLAGWLQIRVKGHGREGGLTLMGSLTEVRKIMSVPTFLIIILQVRSRISV